MSKARTGKIARCPQSVRAELNLRLLNGEPASKILPWLNGLEEVLRILDEYFGEEPVSPQNLSEWRAGGYKEWLQRRENIARTKELSDYSLQLAKAAGGNITDGAAAIMAGRILEALEAGALEEEAEPNYKLKDGEKDGDEREPIDVTGLTDALVALRKTDLDARKVGQRQQLLDQRERQVTLSEKQFRVRTAEIFLEWYGNKRVTEIAEGKATKQVKLDQLVLEIFGAPPSATKKET